MEFIGTQWVLINVGIDLDPAVVQFEAGGRIIFLDRDSEIVNTENTWAFNDGILVIKLYNSRFVFIGKLIEGKKIIGRAKFEDGREWMFLSVRTSKGIFEPKKMALILKNLIAGLRWRITPEQSLRAPYYVNFRSDGSLYTSITSQVVNDAWKIVDDRVEFTIMPRIYKHIGRFEGIGFLGRTYLFSKEWNYKAELDFFEELNEYFPKSDDEITIALIDTSWILKFATTLLSLPDSKTLRYITFKKDGVLDYFDQDGLKMVHISNKWGIINGNLVAYINNRASSLTAKFEKRILTGVFVNAKGLRFLVEGKIGVISEKQSKIKDVDQNFLDQSSKIFTNAKYNENEIATLGVYHKYWLVKDEIRNPECDAYSKLILALKRQEVHALNYFYKEINPLLSSSKFTICYVPSSDPVNINSGIKTLAKRLASTNERINATDCIVRTRKIPKLATGGGRGLSVHLSSLKIEETHLIEGKVILLLDDVTTTNNSLMACKQLLLDAGAKTVYCFALGQTS